MAIDLSTPEKELLTGLLEKELEDVRSEFHHTQAHDFRDTLRCREEIIRGLLAKITSGL
jgi:hypothetical protein